MKTSAQLRKLSDAALARYALDVRDQVLVMQASLSLAKREQRARRQKKARRRKCGRAARVEPRPVSDLLH